MEKRWDVWDRGAGSMEERMAQCGSQTPNINVPITSLTLTPKATSLMLWPSQIQCVTKKGCSNFFYY